MDIETYILTVYDNDGNPIEIPALQGRGIENISRTAGNGAAGSRDIYTITYSDGTTSQFQIYNGKDGTPYTLTDADKSAIASAAAGMIDAPVTSVNGKTGAIQLKAADVGALPSTTTIPSKTSQLADDVGYARKSYLSQLSAEIEEYKIPYIVGNSTTAGTWTGTYDGITEYRDGLTVLYKINVEGVSGGTTLDINGLGAKSVNRNASTAVTTMYPVGTVLMLTYSGGAWLTADYDANTKNTAGTSNKVGTKMYLAGATSQTSSGTTTYTNKNVYIGTDNCLYSNGEKVATETQVNQFSETIADKADKGGWGANKYIGTDASGNLVTKDAPASGSSDSVEILLPSELVAVVGVEFNMYYKSFIRANRSLDNFEIKCTLSNTSIDYKLYKECFRLKAVEANVGSYTLTVQVKDIVSGSVKAEKTVTFHIIKNRSLNNKNVLYLGDSLTFSRGGLYPAEIQYNLSGGKLISIGSQNGSAESNGIGEVKHEGYNGATVGGFLSANVTSGNVNKFYNPSTGQFDLSYFMTNQGYTQLDAVCLNLGHNNLGNHVNAVSGLQTIISKIHEYNADIPVIISLIEPLAGQDGWTAKTKSTAIEMNRHWKNLLSAYITAFDNGKISNVYLSAPYLNIDADNDFPTETVARSARDTTQIVRQNDAMHPGRIGTLKMADVYFANLMYRIPEDNVIYYTVTNNLTNVTTNNNVGSVKEGTSYSATLTPADGYVLDSVTVTMGGNPVTVTNGVINISGVTGNIVITATASVYEPPYDNLADPSTANDTSPNTALTADEWLNGYYISSKKISAKADLIVTNKIPLTLNDTIRIKGIADTGSVNGQTCASRFRVLPCDASGNALLTEIQPAMSNSSVGSGRLECMDATELENGVYCFSPQNDRSSSGSTANYWTDVAYVRICGYPVDGNNANVIVTVNEPIV